MKFADSVTALGTAANGRTVAVDGFNAMRCLTSNPGLINVFGYDSVQATGFYGLLYLARVSPAGKSASADTMANRRAPAASATRRHAGATATPAGRARRPTAPPRCRR